MRITNHKHIPRPGCATHGITAIPHRSRLTNHSAQINIIFNGSGKFRIAKPVAELPVQAMILLVKTLAELFKDNYSVAIEPRMLA